MSKLSEFIVRYKNENDITMREMAGMIGIPFSTLNKYRSGVREYCNYKAVTIITWAKRLSLPITDTLCECGIDPVLTEIEYGTLTEDELKFWHSINKTDSCWNWNKSINRYGYGQITTAISETLAHRYSWILHNGPIPANSVICHTCDNPACCRPSHLFLGTIKENVHDMIEKDRMPRGSKRTDAKLHENDVVEIRKRLNAGEKQTHIAKDYGVSKTVICSISKGHTWKHVP